MPCSDGGRYEDDARAQRVLKKRLDEVTELLCSTMQLLDGIDGDEVTLMVQANVPGLKEWWIQHQAEDAAREAAEHQARERQRMKDEQDLQIAVDVVKKLSAKLGK